VTKAFLEPTILKPENEKFIMEAFSKKSFEQLKNYNKNTKHKLKRSSQKRKLAVKDLFV
jgi:hypothetical protein